MNRSIVIGITALCMAAAARVNGPDLILKSANSNTNTMSGDELISVLEGNVVFVYDDAVIKSQYAQWWRSRGTVHFSKNVRVTKEKQVLTCDRLDYEKSKKQLLANGSIDFYDSKEGTRLLGDHAEYFPDTKFITLTGKPVFIHYDTAAHDTVVIHGEKMTYSDSLKLALVERSVTISKGKLFSRCQTARYFTEGDRAQLRTKPDIKFDHDSLSGDSMDMLLNKRALRGMSVSGNSHGMYKDVSGKDTMITNMFGDSLYMAMNDSGKVDSMWMYRNVKSSYRSAKDSLHPNEAFGKIMILAFTKKGDVDNVKVWGNAKSVYHVEEGDKGVNIATGDSIAVAFKEGKASHVMLSGSVRGYYAPENKER